MARVWKELEPQGVWTYMEEICQIPHGSGNIQKISDYLVAFAKKHNFWVHQETCGTVIMRTPAPPGYEEAPTMILQGHMDMVAMKDAGVRRKRVKDELTLDLHDESVLATATISVVQEGRATAYARGSLD